MFVVSFSLLVGFGGVFNDAPFSISTAYAQPLAPTDVSLGWLKGGSSPPAGQYGLSAYFQYSGSASDLQSFRLYLKRPSDSSSTLAATFTNPASHIVTSGCSQSILSGGWVSRYCANGTLWNISEQVQPPSYYAVGEYQAYIVAVDTAGVDGPASPTAKNTLYGQATILSPVGAQTSSTPVFRWTVPAGWPGGYFWPSVYDNSSYVWDKSLYVNGGATEASLAYDGPALDNAKTYYASVWGEGSGYFSMGASTQSFTVAASAADTSPPTQPTGLLAIAKSSSQIDLSWASSTDIAASSTQASGVTGYKIFRNGVPLPQQVAGLSYSDTGLSQNTTYSYYIKAVDAAGNESPASATVNATTPIFVAAPTNAIAKISSISEKSAYVYITWNDSSDNESEFRVFRRLANTTSGTWTLVQTTGVGTSATYTIANSVTTSGTYEYKVQACNSLGCSAESNVASIEVNLPVPTAIPLAPTNATAKINTISEKSAYVYITWNDNSDNESEFRVFRRLAGGAWSQIQTTGVGTSATYLIADTVTVSGIYEYKVQACNSLGCSAESNVASIEVTLPTYTAAPAAPASTTAKIQSISEKSATVYVSWNDNSDNESGFRVFRRLAGGAWSQIQTTGVGTSATYLIADTVTVSGIYEYKVQACNSLGCSAESNVASIAVSLLVANIIAPSNLVVKIVSAVGDAQMSVGWTDNSDNEAEFRLYRRFAGKTWSQVGSAGAAAGGTVSITDVIANALGSGTYEYKVQACNTSGCSSESSIVSIFVSLPIISVPSAPSNATATITSANENGTSMYIRWSDNSTNESEFKMYRRLSGGTWFQRSTTGGYGGSGATAGMHDSITTSGTYEYKIQACNSIGCSADSNIVSIDVILPVYTSAPAAPSSTATKVYSADENRASIYVGWTDNSNNETSFKVYRRITGGTWFQVTTAGAYSGSGVTASVVDSITMSGAYEYKVQACNSIGCSADSNAAAVSVTLLVYTTAPAAPSNVLAKISSQTDKYANIYISWKDNSDNETSFKVYRRITGGAWFQVATAGAQTGSSTIAAASESITISGTFEYEVQACNSLGCSEFSAPTSIIITSLPESSLPTSTLPIAGNCLAPGNTYTITWDISKASGVDKWVLRYTLDGGTSFTTITELPASANSYAWKVPSIENSNVKVEVQGWGPAPNSSVVATGLSETLLTISAGCGATSITITLPTPTTIPAAPSNLKASTSSIFTDKEAWITLSWTDNSDNEAEFKIYSQLPDGSWVPKGTTLVNNPRSTDVVRASGVYIYKVQACNTLGCSGFDTTSINVTLPVPLAIPKTPSNLKAAPGYIITDKEAWITLTWTDNSDNEAEFKIYSQLPDGSWVPKGTTLVNNPRSTDVVRASGVYIYKVQACNTLGCSGFDTTSINVTLPVPLAIPKTPSNLKAAPGYIITDKEAWITLTWTDNSDNEAEFKIYSQLPDGSWVPKGTTLVNNPRSTDVVRASGVYTYKVQACNTLGCSVFSAAASVYINLLPPPEVATTTTPVQPPTTTLGVTLASSPSSGSAPLSGVDLTAQVSGTAQGTINYTFYCNRSGADTTITSDYSAKYDGVLETAKTAADVCSYAAAGTYSAKVIVERGGSFAESRTTVTVSQPPLPVIVLSPNGGEIFTQGVNNKVSWAGGKNKVQIGLVEPNYDPKTSAVLGWINTAALPASALLWDAKELKDFDGAKKWAVAPGSYKIVAVSENSSAVYCAENASKGCNFDLSDAPFTIAAPPSEALVKVIALDAYSKPVLGATIHVAAKDFSASFGGVTAADGSFSVRVPAGAYTAEAYAPSNRNDLIKPSPIEFSAASGETKEIKIQFGRPIKTITGIVTFTNKEPVPDAHVMAYNESSGESLSTRTDAAGRYTLEVGPGRWMVGIRPVDPVVARWRDTRQYQYADFGSAVGSETRTLNFVVPSADAKITVRATDASGRPLPNIGIVLDMKSAAEPQSPSQPTVPQEFRETDASGLAIFVTLPGQYYVRSFLPQGSEFAALSEQSIRVTAHETREISLVFHKKETVTAATISGVVKLDSGSPIDALIWAWSEKGKSLQGKADADGKFSLQAALGEKWHIGAARDVSGFPYKSSEVIVETNSALATVELVLVKSGVEPLPKPISVSQDAAEQAIAQLGDGAKVIVPAGAAAPNVTITLNVAPTAEAPSQPAAKVVSTVYDVNIKDPKGTAVKNLKEELEIVIPYDEISLKAQGATEDTIVPSYFDEKTGAWVKADNYTIDKKNKAVVMRVRHLTLFALVSPADATPPSAPASAAAKQTEGDKVTIKWTNPASDFSYAKVYRSERPGELGQVISAGTKGGAHTNSGLKEGVKYYYTVRAVDPAGNESVNVNQVSVGVTEPSLVSLPPAQVVRTNILRNLSAGSSGDDVTALQQLLLNEGVYPEGLITGRFGPLTKQAVIRFQEKYADEILTPAGLPSGNGFVGPSTRKKIDELLAVSGVEPLAGGVSAPQAAPTTPPGQALRSGSGQATKATILRNLIAGDAGDDVTALQQLLLDEDVYPEGLITGYFGSLTKQAVIRFQEKYATEILAPVGLARGTGYVGPSTRAKLNQLATPSAAAAPPSAKPAAAAPKPVQRQLTKALTYGLKNDSEVKLLQEWLTRLGVYSDPINGNFFTLTEQAVAMFQSQYSLSINGYVDQETISALNKLFSE